MRRHIISLESMEDVLRSYLVIKNRVVAMIETCPYCSEDGIIIAITSIGDIAIYKCINGHIYKA